MQLLNDQNENHDRKAERQAVRVGTQPVEPPPDRVQCQIHPLQLEDLTGDISKIITSIIRRYVATDHPLLSSEDLAAECRFKLSQIIHKGQLSRCPTRAKAFGYLKTAFTNHIRSHVTKHVFAEKRGGPKRHRGRRKRTAPGECHGGKCAEHISLDAAEFAPQLGVWDPALAYAEFWDELKARLSPVQRAVFDHLTADAFSGGSKATDDALSAEALDALCSAYGLTPATLNDTKVAIRSHARRIVAEGANRSGLVGSRFCFEF